MVVCLVGRVIVSCAVRWDCKEGLRALYRVMYPWSPAIVVKVMVGLAKLWGQLEGAKAEIRGGSQTSRERDWRGAKDVMTCCHGLFPNFSQVLYKYLLRDFRISSEYT